LLVIAFSFSIYLIRRGAAAERMAGIHNDLRDSG